MLLMKLGYRNLWRNRRRTLLTISAMSVATAMVILMLGVYRGMIWDMVETATELYHGHVKVSAEGYMDDRKLQLTLPQGVLRDEIETDPRVVGAAGRVRGFALLSAGEGEDGHTQGGELFGIDPEEEHTVTRLHERVEEGRFLESADGTDMLLAVGLAKRLEAGVGDEIVVMGQAADGSLMAEVFTVTGIVDTADPIRDMSLAIVGRSTLQDLLVLEGRIHEIAVSLRKALGAGDWAVEMADRRTDISVQSWYDFLPMMQQIFDLWDAMEYVFTAIFYLAVLLVASNTMYMAFFERIREFGVMGALGFRTRRLAVLIILEGVIMSGISALVGGAVGIAGSFWLATHTIDLSPFFSTVTYGSTAFVPRIRSYPVLRSMLIPIVMMIILGAVVALFPANKLRRLRPVDVLREV
jgi:ABC-type lipoprotein release transport system permease subunit